VYRVEVTWTNGVRETYNATRYGGEAHGLILSMNCDGKDVRIPLLSVMVWTVEQI
jgi:hypothetical protein